MTCGLLNFFDLSQMRSVLSRLERALGSPPERKALAKMRKVSEIVEFKAFFSIFFTK